MSNSEWKNHGFILKKLPPKQKLMNDIREREVRNEVKSARKGEWKDV